MTEVPTQTLRYLRNPDVVLREEDEDGGLLFNPDTSQVKVVNTTGLFVWQHCDGSRDLTALIAALQQACADAPAAEVAQDVRDFVGDLVSSGFIGTVEPFAGGN